MAHMETDLTKPGEREAAAAEHDDQAEKFASASVPAPNLGVNAQIQVDPRGGQVVINNSKTGYFNPGNTLSARERALAVSHAVIKRMERADLNSLNPEHLQQKLADYLEKRFENGSLEPLLISIVEKETLDNKHSSSIVIESTGADGRWVTRIETDAPIKLKHGVGAGVVDDAVAIRPSGDIGCDLMVDAFALLANPNPGYDEMPVSELKNALALDDYQALERDILRRIAKAASTASGEQAISLQDIQGMAARGEIEITHVRVSTHDHKMAESRTYPDGTQEIGMIGLVVKAPKAITHSGSIAFPVNILRKGDALSVMPIGYMATTADPALKW